LKKNKSRIIKIIAIGLGVLVVIYLAFSAYGAREAMIIPRLPLLYSGDALELPYENVSFYSRGDNVLLKGWFVPGEKNDVIIIVHGGFQNRVDDVVDTLGLTLGLVGKGYNVLLYDLRGRGESGGEGRTLSNIDEDIGGAVDYLENRGYATEHIYILGFCSGAAEACIYASRNDVGKLILDGCFIDIKTEFLRQANLVGVPEFFTYLFMPGTQFFTWAIFGYHMINPIDVVDEISCPILFIHEDNDATITTQEVRRLYEVSANPANEFWEVTSANHSEGFKVHPSEYVEKVTTFLSTR
jgi:pimeloyl-ACP methyl ester carboxylesterase